MAKKPPAPVIGEAKTGPGDPIVLVKLVGAHDYQPCYARDRKNRQILIGGLPCEHVGTALDGTWLYEQRAY